jgi:protein TonB
MTTVPHRELHSELARWSLGSNRPRPSRRLAWANSTCLLFLFIGIVGARTRAPIPKVPAPLEEAAPIVVEAAPPPPVEAAKPPEQAEPEKAPAPLAVVLPSAPTISFAVPAIGALVAPAVLDQAPSTEALRERVSAPAAPTRLDYTDANGGRPAPEYPPLALKLHLQGTVALLMTADANGNIISADVKKSSGSSVLDRAARDFVTLHWKLPKGQAGRVFETSIRYVLM